jgi:hypothetical protein
MPPLQGKRYRRAAAAAAVHQGCQYCVNQVSMLHKKQQTSAHEVETMGDCRERQCSCICNATVRVVIRTTALPLYAL